MVLPDAPLRPHGSRRSVGARQDARWVERGERHGLQPRQSGRLGQPRAARQPRLGVGFDPPRVQGDRGQPARRVAHAWSERPARHLHRREPQHDLRRHDRLRCRGGHAPRRRPQRERRRTHRLHHGHDQERPACELRARLPPPGREASEPHRSRSTRSRPTCCSTATPSSACACAPAPASRSTRHAR